MVPAVAVGRDHLRVCGADVPPVQSQGSLEGSPPRVRSRRASHAGRCRGGRITSACAEQTRPTSRRTSRSRDHLRVCGADPVWHKNRGVKDGSPPRVRSRQRPRILPYSRIGITSACAEQTIRLHQFPPLFRDHLRVCGADAAFGAGDTAHSGSPPRVRSRRPAEHHRICPQGITSACAEQTSGNTCSMTSTRDHLRVCGADVHTERNKPVQWGSPPRVRSRLHGVHT